MMRAITLLIVLGPAAAAAADQVATFSDDVQFVTGGVAGDVTVADLDADGRLDAAVGHGDGTVAVLLSDGAEGFLAPAVFAALAESVGSIVSADFDDDGDTDLAVVGFLGNVHVLFNDGAGGFGPAVDTGQPEGTFGGFLDAADMDDDGDVDLVLNIPAVVLLNDGDGTFPQTTPYFGAAIPSIQTVGDIDGNGLPDIVAADFNAGVRLSFNLGGGQFSDGGTLVTGPSAVFALIVDVNEDGRNDIVVAHSVGGIGGPPGDTGFVAVLPSLGAGVFDDPLFFDVGDNPRRLAAGDLDDDGHVDLLAANGESGTVSVLPGRGDATFGSDVMFGNDPGSLAVADVDADGRLDVLFTAGDLTVLYNRTPARADLNDDGVVNVLDLLILLAGWGTAGP